MRSAPTWSMLLFAACAASSTTLPRALTIESGRRTRVLLADVASGRTFTLQNASSGSRDEIYGDSSNSMIKVVSDADLQQLLDVLAAQGLFERAAAVPVPGARALIAVEQPDRRLIWSRPKPAAATLEQVHAFDAGRGYVIAVYNSETAYHLGTIDSFPPEIRAQMERAKAAANDQGPPK